jgi:hypothetical protein
MKSSGFWDVMPRSLLEISRSFGGACLVHLQETGMKQVLLATCFTIVSCLAYSLTVKMETACSSETSVDVQWTTWHLSFLTNQECTITQ